MKVPQIWLAVLRIVVGAWFLKAVWTKLTVELAWGVVPYLAVSPRFLGPFLPRPMKAALSSFWKVRSCRTRGSSRTSRRTARLP